MASAFSIKSIIAKLAGTDGRVTDSTGYVDNVYFSFKPNGEAFIDLPGVARFWLKDGVFEVDVSQSAMPPKDLKIWRGFIIYKPLEEKKVGIWTKAMLTTVDKAA